MSHIFWLILGLGLAIPATFVVMLNIVLALVNGDKYHLDIYKLFLMYAVALIGWATTFGIRW